LTSDVLLAIYGAKTTFGVTELERFADCSSAWLFERVISPRTIDAEVDPMLRGSVAHSALHKFYAGLPKELGHDRVTPENVEQAVGFLRRCLDDAMRGGVRLELTDLQEAELDQSLFRDLEGFVRDEAASPLQLVPRRFEVSFGSDRSAPELQRGLQLGEDLFLSGKVDRIDVDPYSARGIVQDYKSGRSAHSAKQIDEELKLQIRSTCSCSATSSASSRSAASTARSPALASRAACCTPVQPTTCPAISATTTSRARSSGRWSKRRASVPSDTRGAFGPVTSATTRRAARAPRGATSGRCAGSSVLDVNPSREQQSKRRARSSSPPVRARARPRCWSSGSSAPSASRGSTSNRCS